MSDAEDRGYENPNVLPYHTPGWRSFLKREAFFRHKYHSLVPTHPCVDIMHGDLECRYTHPMVEGHSVSFLNYPWLRGNRESTPAHYRVLTTDLQENDVVAGALDKADEQLRLAIEAMPKDAFVMLNSACVPDVTGENLEQIRKPWEGKEHVFYHESDGKDKSPPFVTQMIKMAGIKKSAASGLHSKNRGRKKRKGVVNLLGIPPGKVEGELVSLLKSAGVRVASIMVPKLTPKRLRDSQSADVHILMPNRLYDGLFREVLAAVELPLVRPTSPYGMEGTVRWMVAVAESAGVSGWESAIDHVQETWEKRWQRLTQEARGRRLGFVVDPAELPILSDPAMNANCPLVPVLKEMGFGLDFLVYDPRGLFADDQGRHKVHTFSTREEMNDKIASLPCGAFYTDSFFDTRLTRQGKGQFSLEFFEAGMEGAVRTLERLLGVCRMPFYGRYAKYLGPGSSS